MTASEPTSLPLAQWLQSWKQGNAAAFASVFDETYVQLRQIAAMRIAKVAGAAPLTPTELLHEAVLRVLGSAVTCENRAHFFASMSIYMRAVLVDHARARLSDKRGAGAVAEVLNVSMQIVDRELRFAKSWLHHHAL